MPSFTVPVVSIYSPDRNQRDLPKAKIVLSVHPPASPLAHFEALAPSPCHSVSATLTRTDQGTPETQNRGDGYSLRREMRFKELAHEIGREASLKSAEQADRLETQAGADFAVSTEKTGNSSKISVLPCGDKTPSSVFALKAFN